ncbi:MAG TPA: XRE family transcriptional regulator [Sneathiellales bacterium]|nr:XRE family transcriptional regulator [Sneathiellales bacterium]
MDEARSTNLPPFVKVVVPDEAHIADFSTLNGEPIEIEECDFSFHCEGLEIIPMRRDPYERPVRAVIYSRTNDAATLRRLREYVGQKGWELLNEPEDEMGSLKSVETYLYDSNHTPFTKIVVPDEEHIADFSKNEGIPDNVEEIDGRHFIKACASPIKVEIILDATDEGKTETPTSDSMSIEPDKDRLDDGSSEIILAVRKQLGKTQVEFADMMGVNKTTVSRWERGDIDVPGPAKQLAKVLLALKPAADLLYLS